GVGLISDAAMQELRSTLRFATGRLVFRACDDFTPEHRYPPSLTDVSLRSHTRRRIHLRCHSLMSQQNAGYLALNHHTRAVLTNRNLHVSKLSDLLQSSRRRRHSRLANTLRLQRRNRPGGKDTRRLLESSRREPRRRNNGWRRVSQVLRRRA